MWNVTEVLCDCQTMVICYGFAPSSSEMARYFVFRVTESEGSFFPFEVSEHLITRRFENLKDDHLLEQLTVCIICH